MSNTKKVINYLLSFIAAFVAIIPLTLYCMLFGPFILVDMLLVCANGRYRFTSKWWNDMLPASKKEQYWVFNKFGLFFGGMMCIINIAEYLTAWIDLDIF